MGDRAELWATTTTSQQSVRAVLSTMVAGESKGKEARAEPRDHMTVDWTVHIPIRVGHVTGMIVTVWISGSLTG